MRAFLFVVALVLTSVFTIPVSAQQKCEGPPELCAQVDELNKRLVEQKAVSDKYAGEKTAEVKKAEEKSKSRTQKLIVFAASLAILLKFLMSALRTWKPYFKTDKGKGWLKIITIGVSFVAFILTNIGFGIPWWQALILAGGGIGSMAFHDMTKLIPVIKGQKKYDQVVDAKDEVKKSDPPVPVDPPPAPTSDASAEDKPKA